MLLAGIAQQSRTLLLNAFREEILAPQSTLLTDLQSKLAQHNFSNISLTRLVFDREIQEDILKALHSLRANLFKIF